MSGRAGLLPHFRQNLGRGLFLILPLLITLWLLALLFRLIDQNVTPAVRAGLEWVGIVVRDTWASEVAFAVLSLLLTVLMIYLLGLFVANLTGKRRRLSKFSLESVSAATGPLAVAVAGWGIPARTAAIPIAWSGPSTLSNLPSRLRLTEPSMM